MMQSAIDHKQVSGATSTSAVVRGRSHIVVKTKPPRHSHIPALAQARTLALHGQELCRLRLASHHIEREGCGYQRVILFNKVHRVSEAAVASLRRKLDRQIRKDSRDRVRVVEAQSQSPRLAGSVVEPRRPVSLVMILEPRDRFRDAWVFVGNARGPQS